jgi:hypothetical protein
VVASQHDVAAIISSIVRKHMFLKAQSLYNPTASVELLEPCPFRVSMTIMETEALKHVRLRSYHAEYVDHNPLN